MSDTEGAAPTGATSQKAPAQGGLSRRMKIRLVTVGLFLASVLCFGLWIGLVHRDVNDKSHALAELVGGLPDSTAKRTVEAARKTYDDDVFLSQLTLILSVILSYGGAIMLMVGGVATKIGDSKKKKAEAKEAEAKAAEAKEGEAAPPA